MRIPALGLAGLIVYSSTLTMQAALASGRHASPAAPAQAQPREPEPLTTQEIAALAQPAVVELTVRGSGGIAIKLGTGFHISKWLVVTNLHVINGAHTITANYISGRSDAVLGVFAVDFGRDLALIVTTTPNPSTLTLDDSSDVSVGDPVVAIGSPDGFAGSVSTGIVSSIRHLDEDTKVFQTSAPLSPGSSGGPLLDRFGEVIGVTGFQYPDGQNLNFAYASGYVQTLWDAQATRLKNAKTTSDFVMSFDDFAALEKKNGIDSAAADNPAPAAGVSPPSMAASPAPAAQTPLTPTPPTPTPSIAAPSTPPPSPPSPIPPSSSANGAPGASGNQDVTVWVNLSTKVYHYRGDRWYGRTKHGAYMKENKAVAKGYHATGNKQ